MAKTLEEVEALLEKVTKEMADKNTELNGLQTLKGKWSEEMGDVRKVKEEFESKLNGLEESRDAFKAEIEALKKVPVKKDEENPPPPSKESVKEQADKLESELTDDEKKLVETILKGASDEDQKSFASNDTYRVAVMKEAKAGNGKEDPKSIWRVSKPKSSSDDLDGRIQELFKKHRGERTVTDERRGIGRPITIEEAKKSTTFI